MPPTPGRHVPLRQERLRLSMCAGLSSRLCRPGFHCEGTIHLVNQFFWSRHLAGRESQSSAAANSVCGRTVSQQRFLWLHCLRRSQIWYCGASRCFKMTRTCLATRRSIVTLWFCAVRFSILFVLNSLRSERILEFSVRRLCSSSRCVYGARIFRSEVCRSDCGNLSIFT
jgi:hypothetical protein